MDEFKLNRESFQDAVYILSEINDEFESVYLKVREKEKRIYSDEELIKLPFASKTNPHKKEWNLRAKSYLRFKEYLRQKKDNLNFLILDVEMDGFVVSFLNHSATISIVLMLTKAN